MNFFNNKSGKRDAGKIGRMADEWCMIQPNLQVSTGDQRGEINSSQSTYLLWCKYRVMSTYSKALFFLSHRNLTSKRHRTSYVQHDISPSFPKATWNSNFLVRLGGIFQDSARIKMF